MICEGTLNRILAINTNLTTRAQFHDMQQNYSDKFKYFFMQVFNVYDKNRLIGNFMSLDFQ